LNKQIKDGHTFRERLPFPSLIAVIERMVEFDWSVGRSAPNDVGLIIPPHVFADAYKVQESGRKLLTASNNQKFILPSEAFASLEKAEIKDCSMLVSNSNFDSFDDYEATRFKVSAYFCLICNLLIYRVFRDF
jgi:hypothetical protein